MEDMDGMEEVRGAWSPGVDDDEMRGVETAAARTAGRTTGGATGPGAEGPEEDKGSSDGGGSSAAGDQSDADATRMSDEQSDGRGASRSRFQAEQALSVRTASSPDGCGDEQVTASEGVKNASPATTTPQSTSATSNAKPEEENDKAAAGTAATPSTGKKRRRRTAAQIDRKYKCNFPGCSKAYGSEGSLTQHQRLKFHKPRDESRVAARKNPEKSFLPLHRSPSSHLKAGSFLLPTTASAPPPGVSIRPATMGGGIPGSPYHVASPSPSAVRGERGAAASTTRSNLLAYAIEASEAQNCSCNLRSRSNSMPISFTIPSPAQIQCAPASAPRSSTRKPRVSSTPRPKSTTARRTKSRSKSESLSGFVDFAALDGMQPPRSDRSISDSTASTHESVMAFEATADTQPMRPSWPVADVTMSMEDQAIDSDILSVLANCDAAELGELGDGLASLAEATPPADPQTAFSSRTFGPMGDQDMLPAGFECFNIAEGLPAVGVAGSVKQERFRDGHGLQHEVGNEHAVGARVGAGSLFSTPGVNVKEEPPITALDPLTDSFGLGMFDAPAENDMHSLSQLNSFSSGVSSGHSSGVSPIQVFKTDTSSETKYHDPGTPLQDIPAKLGRLNIDNPAGWRDVTSILNEPDSEEQLSQDPQQPPQLAQPQDSPAWTKGSVLNPASSSSDVDHSQFRALRTPNEPMDWHTASKLAAAPPTWNFQTPALFTESTMPGLFGDFLMSEAAVDSRLQAQVFGPDDDLL